MSVAPAQASASVIIPAHNEAGTIDRCLTGLLAQAQPDEFEVLVVCNGCTDDTAARAARPGVRVIEIAQASKVAALNAGDRVAGHFPRIYLDADLEVSTESARRLLLAISEGAVAAGALPDLDLSHCDLGSRWYFTFWSHLGFATRNRLGAFYALSRQGRARFGDFPDLIADDAFVYSQFQSEERVNPAGATFRMRPPRTLRATIRTRTRIMAGNQQLRGTGAQLDVPPPYWREVLVSSPRLVGPGLVYLGVNLVARTTAAIRASRREPIAWNHDATSRSLVGTSERPQ